MPYLPFPAIEERAKTLIYQRQEEQYWLKPGQLKSTPWIPAGHFSFFSAQTGIEFMRNFGHGVKMYFASFPH